jgi:hypothetical protein
MKPLSELIREAQEEAKDEMGLVNHRVVGERMVDIVGADVLRERSIDGFARLSKRLAQSTAAEIVAADQPDLPFSELHGAYAVLSGETGDACTKKTSELTRMEFERAIRIREEGIRADTRHLNVMKNVLRAVSHVWDRNPEWVFAQVCRAWSIEAAA